MTTQNKINIMSRTVVPWRTPFRFALMMGTGMIISGCASLQGPDAVTTDLLMRKLDEREKLINDLQLRVGQLEIIAQAQKTPNTAATAAETRAPGKTAVNQPANKPPIQQKAAMAQQGKTAAGSFEVDQDAAQRALERTLVQTGALLLPFGQAEIQPFATYSRRETKQPFLLTGNNSLQVANASIRNNEFDMGANLLVGLPFESQAELRIPYQVINQSVVIPAGTNSQETSNTGNSIGDINIGLAKTLVHESGWIPDLIARLTWNAPSGSTSSNNVAMGGGFNAFGASMTALKRQDPLAFTGRVAYQKTLKNNGIEPGDQLNLSIGATLAASPQTSLSIGLQQTYAQETKINNINVQGSDNVSSAFTVGASSTIGRSLFVSVLGGIGLTDSSPAYFLNITVPFRFDTPYKSTEKKR